jgi:uncharacterized OsmC-like protein
MTNEIAQAIGAARGHLAEHPEEAAYTDSAAVAVVEDGLRCRVEGPLDASIVTDMPPGVGGRASAPSPGWLSRAAHAGCEATVIAMRAAELGIRLDRLEVVVDGESDDRGLLAVDETVTPGPSGQRVRVRIAAEGVETVRLRELVEWADRHSPLSDLARRAVPLSVETEVVLAHASEGNRSTTTGARS